MDVDLTWPIHDRRDRKKHYKVGIQFGCRCHPGKAHPVSTWGYASDPVELENLKETTTMDGKSQQLAILGAKACQRAYADPNLIQGNAQARVDYDPKSNVATVAFAGTNDALDVIQDVAIARRVEIGKIRIHRGFWAHSAKISQAARNAYNELHIPKDATTIICGHSLGAAVAAIEMFRHPTAWKRPAVGFLYGCPRVGNVYWSEAFASCVPMNVWRIVSEGDPVSNLPWHWFGRWAHVGTEIVIGRGFDIAPDHTLSAYIRGIGG